ncbi:MAG: pyruvate ferredoxin oxidoreductase, partial [Pyrobaculum sp.]
TEEGPTFLHILAPCPPGWRFPEERTVEAARLAVETGYFPLYEYDHGKVRLNPPTSAIVADPKRRKPLREFLKFQGRFAHLTDAEIEELEKEVVANLNYLAKLASL